MLIYSQLGLQPHALLFYLKRKSISIALSLFCPFCAEEGKALGSDDEMKKKKHQNAYSHMLRPDRR